MKVNREIAEAEIQSWLDYKKITQKARESQIDQVELLIESVMEGVLVLNEDKSLTHLLKFPIGDSVTQLEYKPRLQMSAIHQQLQGVKPSDADGRLLAFAAALTSKAKGIIQALDTEDYKISQAITIFFL